MDAAGITPFVRHMLLCDDVGPNPNNPHKVTIHGLLSHIRAKDVLFPVQHSFAIYLAMTEGRESGEGRIVIVHSDTGEVCYTGQPHIIVFPSNPLQVHGAIFRISSCSFPQPGLYWVEFLYQGVMVVRQSLLVN